MITNLKNTAFSIMLSASALACASGPQTNGLSPKNLDQTEESLVLPLTVFTLSDPQKLAEHVKSFAKTAEQRELLLLQVKLHEIFINQFSRSADTMADKVATDYKPKFFRFVESLGVSPKDGEKLFYELCLSLKDKAYLVSLHNSALEGLKPEVLSLAAALRELVNLVLFGKHHDEYVTFNIDRYSISPEEVERGRRYFLYLMQGKFKGYESLQSIKKQIAWEEFSFVFSSRGREMLDQFDGMKTVIDYAKLISNEPAEHPGFLVYLIRTFSENYKLGLDFCDLLLKMDKFFTDLKKLDGMQVNDNSLKTLLSELRRVENINDFKKILVKAQDRINLLLQLIAHSSLRK